MKKPDRPKTPKLRNWVVEFDDGDQVTIEAEYRGAARHYAKREMISPDEHYRTVRSARLMREA